MTDDTISWRHLPRRSSKTFDLQFANNDIFKANYSIDCQFGCWSFHLVTSIFPPLCFFFRISSYHVVNCWSHALVNGPTSKGPASDGGRCSGQLLMMWSPVCSGSPHSHAALSASPHFFMDALNRPTPVLSLFGVVQCFRLRSSPLTPHPGSDTC